MTMTDQNISLIERYKNECTQRGWIESRPLVSILETVEKTTRDYRHFQQSNHWLRRLLKPAQHPPLQGVYLWGPVGRGKTYLMDLFYEHTNEQQKRRWHFTEFMQHIHELLTQFSSEKSHRHKKGQPIQRVAHHLAHTYQIICLDEFQVTEIGEAMILYRLFDHLLQAGVFFVVTSNCPPDQLYRDGLHFDRFEPFIHLIQKKWRILAFNHDSEDYRRFSTTDQPGRQWSRRSHNTTSKEHHRLMDLEIHFMEIERKEGINPASFLIHGRDLVFLQATPSTLWTSFSELCEQPYGPGEYQAIAKHFKRIFITHIPPLNSENRDETRRFITLIDCLYDENVSLYCHCDHSAFDPDSLYTDTGPRALPFARTASRLIQMTREAD